MTKLIIGTWKTLDKLSELDTLNFINDCINSGLKLFDTAPVYSNGRIETLLGKFDEIKVVTKIPASRKPLLNENIDINSCYNIELLRDSVEISKSRLNSNVNIFMLHNWNCNWNFKNSIIYELIEIKNKGLCKKIGISLPNFYTGKLDDELLDHIDVIMAPYNNENKWIEEHFMNLKNHKVEILCRSIFKGGNEVPRTDNELIDLIRKVTFSDYLVVGATNVEHLLQIDKILKEKKND